MNHLLIFSQAEWDKYFPIEQNTGDLNIPDFDFANFTGDMSGQTINTASYNPTGNIGFNLPTAEDLAEVDFTSPNFFVTNRPGANPYLNR